AEVVAAHKAAVVEGAPDAEAITEQTDVPVNRYVEDGDTVDIGNCPLRVLRLTGHTPGSIALLYDDGSGRPHLFTGDSLFPGGVGNTRGNASSFATLIDDLEPKLFDTLPH